MEVYLDNSATTRCLDEVRELMDRLYDRTYGNPSSLHNLGVLAEKEIRKAREIIADTLRVSERELIFTSGGTESDNMALFGTVLCKSSLRRGKHIISTEIEHPAILSSLKELEDRGFEVTLLGVDSSGRADPRELKEALRKDTVLVSIMHTNNEIGSVQALAELSETVKSYDPGIIFHTDAVQGYGKARIHPKKAGIDLLSASGHKFHGPKGTGFLYVSDKVRLSPLIFGGGQQNGMRSGTENVQGIAGMAAAAEIVYGSLEEDRERLFGLKRYFIGELLKTEGVAGVNGLTSCVSPEGDAEGGISGQSEICRPEDIEETAPHIVSVSFEKVRAEVMLHALEEKGIYVSAGSACSSNRPSVSKTLRAVGLKDQYLDKTVRFSFSRETTKAELEYTLRALKEILPVLGRFVRR